MRKMKVSLSFGRCFYAVWSPQSYHEATLAPSQHLRRACRVSAVWQAGDNTIRRTPDALPTSQASTEIEECILETVQMAHKCMHASNVHQRHSQFHSNDKQPFVDELNLGCATRTLLRKWFTSYVYFFIFFFGMIQLPLRPCLVSQ